VERVQKSGHEVFLDLKLHDIPTTVAKTARIIADREIFMFDVHTFGGFDMMLQARKAIDEGGRRERRPLLLGVTILTSHSENVLSDELGVKRPLAQEVLHLARLGQKAGLDGVVSSPEETELLRSEFGKSFILVAPGIRPLGSGRNDQLRTVTPQEAVRRGADYLVVGRPITASDRPREATQQILQSLT
jgi:orotidine-5'-phosphate decarboxylase